MEGDEGGIKRERQEVGKGAKEKAMEKEPEKGLELEVDEENGIPLGKLRANIEKVYQLEKEKEEGTEGGVETVKKKMVVLLATGSYCPVHKMHVQVFEAARQVLESRHQYIVVGGWISPSHDDYVGGKMISSREPLITAQHRLAMCDLLVKNSGWLSASSWEARQSGFIDFPSVAVHHAQVLARKFTDDNLQLMFVAGADLASKCMLHNGLHRGSIPVVAIGRPGHTHHIIAMARGSRHPVARVARGSSGQQTSGGREKFIVVETEMEDFSSTLVRKLLKAGKPVDHLCGPLVAQFLRDNAIDQMFTGSARS